MTGSLGPGGTELAVMTLARELTRRGRVKVSVAVLASGGSWAEGLRREGVEVEELGISGPIRTMDSLRRLGRLRKLVRTRQISIVHTFLFEADLYGMLAARLGGPEAVITTRRAIKAKRPHHLRGYAWTNFLVDRIVANSLAVREFTIARERVQPEKVLSIPNGVDFAHFSAGRRAPFRERFGVEDDEVLVGAVGTIKPVKGQDLLLDAIEPLLDEGRPIRLVLAGEITHPFGEALQARARRWGDRVILPGTLDAVADLLAALDVFVLPSRSEGMSNALLEAMAAGRAILATEVGGNAENLDGGHVGRLVPPEDSVALRGELARLIEDARLREELGSLAARRAKDEYSLDRMLDQTEALYEELLAR